MLRPNCLPLKPFLKWPGGKRWAAPQIAALVKKYLNGTYYEPFLGGGAVFFSLSPVNAVLSDINEELVNTYLQVKHRPSELIGMVREMPVTASNFRNVRASCPTSDLDRAARTLYLNRTAFGGLYRLNKQGQFNVPFGGGHRTPEILWTKDLIAKASAALARAIVLENDFEPVLRSAKKGDVVYCDPTYTVAHENNGFRRYNERNFSWEDQQRLATAAKKASAKGVVVIISNAFHQSIRALHSGATVKVMQRYSAVAAAPQSRRMVREFLLAYLPH